MLSTVKKVGKGVGSLFVSNNEEAPDMYSTKITAISLHVLSASDLIASDANGLSDPYVVIKLGESRQWRSVIATKTLDPVWEDQRHTLDGMPLALLPWVTLEVWDSDVASADDPLGMCLLPVQQLLAAGGPLEIPLGRASPRLKAKGSVTVELHALPTGSPNDEAETSPLPEDAVRFAALCQEADSAPDAAGLHIARHERLEVCIRGVTVSVRRGA